MNAAPLLQIANLVVEIQSMPALRGFSIDVARGAMVSLVGRNGAGKTTLMRSIMGHLKPAHGAIRFDGADLAAYPRHLSAPESPAIGCHRPRRSLSFARHSHDMLSCWIGRILQ